MKYFLLFLHQFCFADQPLVKCSFVQEATPKIQFTTIIDQYGMVKTQGLLSGKKFDCTYKIQEFKYLPGAVVPNAEFLLKKNKCVGESIVVGRLKKSTSLFIKNVANGFACTEDLVTNYPAAIDRRPYFDGKNAKRLNEKFRNGVWP